MSRILLYGLSFHLQKLFLGISYYPDSDMQKLRSDIRSNIVSDTPKCQRDKVTELGLNVDLCDILHDFQYL